MKKWILNFVFILSFTIFSGPLLHPAEPESGSQHSKVETLQEKLRKKDSAKLLEAKPSMLLNETQKETKIQKKLSKEIQSQLTGIETYVIDNAHSSVAFKVRHLVSIVKGEFTTFEGTIQFDVNDLLYSSTKATIGASSIHTNNDKRDNHLMSTDFFDVKQFPTITFVSTKIEGSKLIGDLTMHGVTKEIELNYVFHGTSNDSSGGRRVGFSATALIDRRVFGITYNKEIDQVGMMLGYEIPIEIEIEAIAK